MTVCSSFCFKSWSLLSKFHALSVVLVSIVLNRERRRCHLNSGDQGLHWQPDGWHWEGYRWRRQHLQGSGQGKSTQNKKSKLNYITVKISAFNPSYVTLFWSVWYLLTVSVFFTVSRTSDCYLEQEPPRSNWPSSSPHMERYVHLNILTHMHPVSH